MVAVVGRLFQKWFPAQPNLSYTFIWDKTDAYGQRVYGLSEAVGEFAANTNTKQKITDVHLKNVDWFDFSERSIPAFFLQHRMEMH